MPRPVKRGSRYMPGLDGLRAIAVLAVIAYHVGLTWLPGGLLGVGVFFTLSGYLITDLLLSQRERGRLDLRAFWLGRARRLLPASLVMLVVVSAWVTVIGPHQPAEFRTAVITAGLYVNNWWLILHDVSYFDALGGPAPLNHLWSLSVEEQFYIVWPLLLALGITLVPTRPSVGGARGRLAAITLGLAVVSGVLMAVLYRPGVDPSRVYYGTDTRCLALLVGAALALAMPSRRLRPNISVNAARTIDGAGVVGLTAIAWMFATCDEYSPFLYRGGFAILAIATALVVATLVHPAGRLATVVGCRPMRWIGERSYGLYLWHYPIIFLTSPSGAHDQSPLRAIAQVAAAFGVAAVSWRFLEDPIRHGAVGRALAAIRSDRPARRGSRRAGWAIASAASAVLVAAVAGLAGAGVDTSRAIVPGKLTVAKTVSASPDVAKTRARPASRTSCRSVVHIGDSTSEGLVSSAYLPDPRDQISAWYTRVGATTQHFEISGARSIFERFRGQPNAHDVAVAWQARGFRGCWLLALGTNEAANVTAGSKFTFEQRISSMMSVAGSRPVLWVNVKAVATSGPYTEPGMAAWDGALISACARYPNMRVFDWASAVRDEWFVADGIHFTSEGYAQRGRLIAGALVTAFPDGSGTSRAPRSSCLVTARRLAAPARPRPTPVAPETTGAPSLASATGT